MRFITPFLLLFFIATTANASNHPFKPADLLNEGTPSGQVPNGLTKAVNRQAFKKRLIIYAVIAGIMLLGLTELI